MSNENNVPENAAIHNDDIVETDFDDEIILAPTALERELGREVDDEERSYVEAAIKTFDCDATRAAIGFALFCQIRQQYE
jgi:hypothetical protein